MNFKMIIRMLALVLVAQLVLVAPGYAQGEPNYPPLSFQIKLDYLEVVRASEGDDEIVLYLGPENPAVGDKFSYKKIPHPNMPFVRSNGGTVTNIILKGTTNLANRGSLHYSFLVTDRDKRSDDEYIGRVDFQIKNIGGYLVVAWNGKDRTRRLSRATMASEHFQMLGSGSNYTVHLRIVPIPAKDGC